MAAPSSNPSSDDDLGSSGPLPTPFVLALRKSPTISAKMKADQLAIEGRTVYNFGAGEMNPGVPVPDLLVHEINAATSNGETTYSASQGDPELISALRDDLEHNFGLKYSEAEIAICPGPKDAIWKLCVALLSPTLKRNRVVAFAPTFESFTNVPPLITGLPTIELPTDPQCMPEVDALNAFLKKEHDTIAVIIINSPNNPSGAVYSAKLLQQLADVIGRYPQIAVLSDEVYRTIRYDDTPFASIATFLPNQTFVIGGMSKELSGTGLRVGFVAGHEAVISAIVNINANTSSCTNMPAMKGYARFLKQDKECKLRYQLRDALAAKRAKMMSAFDSLPGLLPCHATAPQGAFYVFPSVAAFIGKKTPDGVELKTDEDLCVYLSTVAGVVAIAGSAFGKPGYIRLAYALSSLHQIQHGLAAMSQALSTLT